MDGASKFVKGDAVAGIIIIAINLVGGITIGMLQQGMGFGDAALRPSRCCRSATASPRRSPRC